MIKNIITSFLITAVMILTVMNTPSEWWSFKYWSYGGNLTGISLTDITGSTQVSDYPSIQNTINTTLETAINDLLATTTYDSITTLSGLTTASSLATVGTITSGTWNATDVAVAAGGTGASSFTQYGLIFGSSTNPLHVLGDLGTSGQFLTSQGAGSLPQWTTSSVDEGLEYNWTNHHTFTSAFFTAASSTNASTTNDQYVGGDLTVAGLVDFSGASSVSGIAVSASSTTYSSTGTYTKSNGAKKVLVQLWGGGASGNSGDNISSGGGGGGQYIERWFDADDLGASETVTVGTGGAAVNSPGAGGCNTGNAGNDSTFGSHLTAGGGQVGTCNSNPANDTTGGRSGRPADNSSWSIDGLWPTGASGAAGKFGLYSSSGGGASSGGTAFDGGHSVWGGAGGAGVHNTDTANGGSSIYGGNGGGSNNTDDASAATSGTVPSGGGGSRDSSNTSAASGAGADGQAIVTEFF